MSKDKQNTKRKLKLITKVLIALDIGALLCLFIAYGPFVKLQNLFVTTSMETMTHKYLARTIYSEEKIVSVLKNNRIFEVEGNTDIDDIKIGDIKETDTYSSIYEEQILKKDIGNDLYKVIPIEGNGYKGNIVAIYDPSRVKLVQSPYISNGGQLLDQMVRTFDAEVAINAGGFGLSGKAQKPIGPLIMDGKLVSNYRISNWGDGIIGFTQDNVLVLTKDSPLEAIEKYNLVDGVNFGPFLIVNGEASKFQGNGGYGLASRTAIAQRKDGIILFVVIDGRRPGHSLGVDMVELTNLLLKYGAYNASNLDGGGSSTLYANDKILSVPGGIGYSGNRYLPNAWIVK